MVVTRKAVDVDTHGLGNISSRWLIGPGGSGGSGLGDGTLPRTSPRLPTKRAARLPSHMEVTPKAPLGAAGRRACPGKAEETGCCGMPHWSVRLPTHPDSALTFVCRLHSPAATVNPLTSTQEADEPSEPGAVPRRGAALLPASPALQPTRLGPRSPRSTGFSGKAAEESSEAAGSHVPPQPGQEPQAPMEG